MPAPAGRSVGRRATRPPRAPGSAAPRGAGDDRAARTGLIVALAVTLVVFARVTGLGFIGSNWDDGLNIFENAVHRLPLGESLARSWAAPYFASYIPVTRSVWSLLWHAAPEPWAFHAANLAVHLLSVGLAFGLLRRLAFGAAASTIGALVFAVHPVQVEAVSWATGMKDLLAAAFMLVALWFALRHLEQVGPRRASAGWAPLLISTIAFAAAVFSKPSAVATPILFVVLARFRGHPWGATLWTVAPWVVVLVPYLVVARSAEIDIALEMSAVAPWQRPIIFADAIGFYLYKLVAPWPLAADYGRSPGVVLAQPWWPPFALGALALGAFLATLARRRRAVLAGALLFVVAILPVSGLEPFLFQRISTVADRYLYPAMFGVAVVVAALLDANKSRVWRVAAAAAVCVLGAIAFVQIPHWRDERTLFEHALRVNPESRIAALHVAVQRAHQGKLDEALGRLRDLRRRYPEFPEAHANLGNVFYVLEQPDSAIASFTVSVQLDPRQADHRANLAQLLALAGRHAEARAEADAALRLAPSSPHVRGSAAFVDSLARLAGGAAAGAAETRPAAP